jgi:hypothetical protein
VTWVQPIRKRRPARKKSLRWELILGGAVRVYPGGREVCQNNPKGQAEYRRRTLAMAEAQKWVCGLAEAGACKFLGEPMRLGEGFYAVTFEHADKRGPRQDDRIPPATKNCAAHLLCNSELGSRRSPDA